MTGPPGWDEITAALGARFGELTPVAAGGMARVYRGFDTARDRPVAVKVLMPEMLAKGNCRPRFLREARWLEKLDHPRLVRVFETGEDPCPWYSMELLEGCSLTEHLRLMGPLPWTEAAAVVVDLLEGLYYLHSRGLVHRDVKPPNLLLDADRRGRLCDLGLVREPEDAGLTRLGQVMGTVYYMAPEVLLGLPATRHSDLFSAGLVLLECLHGRRYYGPGGEGRVRAPRFDWRKVLADKVPSGLVHVLDGLLKENPAARYDSAAQALTELRPLAEAAADPEGAFALGELVTLDLKTLGPLRETFEFLAGLAPAHRALYLREPENLRPIAMGAWEVSCRTARFRDLTDETSVVGVDAWKLFAGQIGEELKPVVVAADVDAVPRAAGALKVTSESLRASLRWARVDPVAHALAPVRDELADRLRLVLPDDEVPVYSGGDLAETRARIAGVFRRVLGACPRPNAWVSLSVRHRLEELTWVVTVQGRDLALSAEDAGRLAADDAVAVARGDGGGLVLRMPALWGAG